MSASAKIDTGDRRLDVLDGLRGIAVLLVLWYHTWEISWLPAPWPRLEFIPETGFIGVHLFFFLSGFVIVYPFLRARLAGTVAPTWRHFAYRRCIKIIPSYLLSIALAYAIGYAATQGTAPAWANLLTHLTFVHTWWPQTYGGINGVLWTLAVEVEFYCIFPLVWWCFARRPLLTALGMIAIAYAWRAGTASCCLHDGFASLEENVPGYLDIFAFGMLAAWIFVRYGAIIGATSWRRFAPIIAIVATLGLAALLINLYDSRLNDQWASIWQIRNRPLLGAAFTIVTLASLLSPRWWQNLLGNPLLRFLAVISYNLYLYHQIIARELLRLHLPPYSGDPHADVRWQITYTVCVFTVSIAQAALFTYVFERPIMRLRAFGPRKPASGY